MPSHKRRAKEEEEAASVTQGDQHPLVSIIAIQHTPVIKGTHVASLNTPTREGRLDIPSPMGSRLYRAGSPTQTFGFPSSAPGKPARQCR
ncbi:hypothetical protein E2C01_084163 [Portunus trituberculatus]|uniref:Uncharacterized protein n=1 Tax=Portunus trituberculatus TaxID=210409 RepID=A0A5B7J5K2_PORTR|nr:hypothetical protein [Portunus trituberculatus]